MFIRIKRKHNKDMSTNMEELESRNDLIDLSANGMIISN